ncbi:MAG TPA: radical SAM protein [Candidatus Cloacimonadota bacterium]|nr:radical SAM protein [Candidatus Cloacimonadota bacterium]
MRILLVSPIAHTMGLESLRSGNQILQGILYIGAAAKTAGHQTVVVIAGKGDIDKYIRNYRPEIIGVSCVTSTYPVVRELLIYLKEKYPELPTIIGGHHATFMYKEVIEETGVTYVCRGEGEEVFVGLLDSLKAGEPYPSIEGIVFYKDGKYHNDNEIAILSDLDNLPMITKDLIAPGFGFAPKVVSSRGCPFNCSFCSISAFYGGKYRQRKVEAVLADIREFLSWGYKHFWFHDDNLTVDKAWVTEFCRSIIDEGLKFRWNCMSRVDSIVRDPELMGLMSKAGCSLVSIGIESGIPEVLERMHKKIDLNSIKTAIKILDRNHISHNWYMILGSADEFDTPEYLEKNIRFFQSLHLGYVLISILTPFPGTELFNKLRSEDRILHYDWEKFDAAHCVYKPLGMKPKELEDCLPKAYLRVYLSKGWRLIPLFWNSIRSGAIRPRQIYGSAYALMQYVFLGRSLDQSLKK